MRAYAETVSTRWRPAKKLRRSWADELDDYRNWLEKAWSLETIHPEYADLYLPLSPRGQCGVTSAWITYRLDAEFKLSATYCYGEILDSEDDSIVVLGHHCWVEVGRQKDSARLIVDLTADQIDHVSGRVVCESYQDILKRGMRYRATTRLRVGDLIKDGVWERLRELNSAMGEHAVLLPKAAAERR